MRGSHSSHLCGTLVLAAVGSLLAGCSDSFDNPFEGTCSASIADTLGTPQAGDPAGSYRLVVQSSCAAGPAFGTLLSTGTWLVVPTGESPNAVAISFDGTYARTNGEVLNLKMSAVGEVVPGPGPVPGVVFSGTETFHGGTGVFDGCSGSAVISQGGFAVDGGNGWQFDGTLTAHNNELEL